MKFNIISENFIGKSKVFDIKDSLIGGQEVSLYDLSKFLTKKGHDITVIQKGEKNVDFVMDDIKVKKIKSRLSFRFFWKSQIDKNADIIHLHDYEYAFPFGNESVTGTCLGVSWDCPTNVGGKSVLYWWTRNKYHKFLANYAIKNLKRIISIDSFLLRYVQSEFPNYRYKIKVILGCVNTNLFNPNVSGKEIKKLYGNRSIILFPRNLTYVRGTSLILKALKIVREETPNVILLILGEGPEKERMRSYVKDSKLEKNVDFVGHKDYFTEMPKYYAASDVVVIPSLCREGCSLACLEAMATRKPVVVTNTGGLLDIVIDEYSGLISRLDETNLAEKILYLLNNKNGAKKISKNGYKWVKKRHTYKRWCKQYSEFFNL